MQISITHVDKQFWRKLIDIGLPVSLQALMFSVLGMVDVMMVSQLGEAATAAVGVGNRIVFFNLLVIFGISGALGVLASQYFGAKNSEGIRITLAQSLVLAMIVTTPFIALYSFNTEWVVGLISDEPSYLVLARDYLIVTGVSLYATAIVVPMESALRAIGDAKMPTRIGLIAILVNVALNALLIFGLFGFPELGVLGAAIGTTISRAFQTGLLLYLVKERHAEILPNRSDWSEAFQLNRLKRFGKISIPLIFQDGMWAAGLIVLNSIVGKMGVTELAILSFLAPIEGVMMSAFLGFAVGASVILGNEIGANNIKRVEQTAWWYVIFGCSFAAVVAVLFWVASPLVYEVLLLTPINDTDTLFATCTVIVVATIIRVFTMVGIGGILKSGGDVNYCIIINTFSQWCLGIPFAYYAATHLGWPLHYVLMGIILVEESVKSALVAVRIQSKKWINNLVAEPSPSV